MRRLEVRLEARPDHPRAVGVLAEDRGQIWFEFDPAFARDPLPIAPLTLDARGGRLIQHHERPGVPLPGVFGDSLPDGWGLRILHRTFQALGRPAASVSPLEELAFLGRRTMGALTYHPCTGPEDDLADALALADVARHAVRLHEGQVEQVLPELVRAGSSPGGARPKALVGLRDDDGAGVSYGDSDLDAGWSAWLVKFPAQHEDPDVGRRELAWMHMASAAGIEVPSTRVVSLEGVGDAFAVRRFDRPGDHRRIHMLSAAGALDADFRTTLVDYRDLARLVSVLCDGEQAQVAALFRLAVFNVVAVNEDDHLKNFAFLLDDDGRWRLSPAFDLTYAPHPSTVRTTTVMGAEREVGREHFRSLAEAIVLPRRRAMAIVDEVLDATSQVRHFLDAAGCRHAVSEAAANAVDAARTHFA